MHTGIRTAIAGAIAAAGLVASGPAWAVTFANFTQVGVARTIHWVRDANSGAGALNGTLFSGPNAGVHGAIAVRFNFQLPALAVFENLPALLTVEAREMGHAATLEPTTNSVTQTEIDGNTPTTGFSILYNGPTVVLGAYTVSAGANLLSGRFTNLWLQGGRLSNAGSAADSDPTPGTVAFTSDFLDLSMAAGRGLSWNLTSISPTLGFQPGSALPSFNASVAGSFSAAVAPEPGTWAMMIGGFAAAGAVLRRRRAVAAQLKTRQLRRRGGEVGLERQRFPVGGRGLRCAAVRP